jgi:DNA-binding beta-propeller fold protein YncE
MRRITSCAFAFALAVSLLVFSARPAAAKRILFNDLNNSDVRSIELDGSNLHTVFSTPLVSTSLAYEPAANKIYWAVDIGDNYIARANLDGTSAETLPVSDGPDSLAIDSAAQRIYFGSEDNGTVQRANLDGTGGQVLYTDLGSVFYGAAVNSAAGKIYWTSTGNNRFIHRANLDGSGHENLITGPGPHPLFTFGDPYGIALDVAGGKLYFSDADDNYVYRANLDGSELERFAPAGMLIPLGIAIDLESHRLFWAQPGAIGAMDLDGSNPVLYNVEGVPNNLAIVPEPASWMLLLSGVVAIGLRARHRSG